jgi:exodeoxyribonuclease III
MIISSYNVNGIRAATKKGLAQWIRDTKPDVICLQEIKAEADQIPDEIRELGYFEYYHSAEKKGYSGVAILSKFEPEAVEVGMGTPWIDGEGRVLKVRVKGVDIYSIYAPSGTSGDIRQQMKYEFLDAFSDFARPLLQSKSPVVLCGDFNIAHKEIDIHNPVSNKNSSGFLPEERAWFSEFLELGYKDIFRELHPNMADLYSWWTYRAGAKGNNKGWRIDYHLGSPQMLSLAKQGRIERELDLSDHVPVTIEYDI